MLFQPSNIYPSTFSGIGAGTVDVTQGLNVSWQVNGDTPMTAYQIKIYQNDSGSTLMYDSGSVTVSPAFEPHDKYGNATYFTAIISAATLSTAGIVNGYQYGYKMLITQWWGVSDYVEQTSASVFITRSTPNISIDAIPNPVAASSITITATYSQAQGDPISTVEWVFALAGSESNPIRKTGAISTQVLSFDADGLITGNTYSIMCNVVTSTGMEASTGFVRFPVLYSSSSLGINYQLAQLKNSSAVYLSWDDLGSNILSYPYTDTTKTTNGITFTVNGEGDVVVTGTATADAYFTIAEGTPSQLGMTAGKKFVITSGYSGSKIVITETNGSNVVASTIEGSDPLQYIATSTTNTLKISIVIPSGSVLSSGQQLKPMIALEDKIVAYNAVSANIEPIQDLHGYANPWPAGGGKNLVPTMLSFLKPSFRRGASAPPGNSVGTWNDNVYTISGITFTVNDDGTITVNGTSTEVISFYFIVNSNRLPITAGSYIIHATGNADINLVIEKNGSFWGQAKTSNTTVTADADAEISCYSSIASGKTFTNFVLKPMFEKGTTASEWQPYSNICPITGLTGLSVYRTGKNLLDFENKSLPFNGNRPYTVLDFGEDKTFPALTLTFFMDGAQYSTNSSAICDYLKNDGTHQYRLSTAFGLDSANVNTGAFSKSETNITFQKLVVYLGTDYGAYTAGTCSIQLELGSSTAYEPYNGNTYAVDWSAQAGTVYGGTLDVVTGVLTVDRANIPSYNGETINEPWLSSMDAYAAGTTPTIGAQVVYTLATPLTYQLTPTQVSALVGTNNVLSTGDSVSVTYTKDTGAQATLTGPIVSFSNTNAQNIPTPQFVPGITGLSIYRYLQGELALQHVYDLATGATSILDYFAPSQTKVSYLLVAHSNAGDLFLQTNDFVPTFWFYSVLLCDTDSNGNYHVSREYIFKYGVETGAVSNNNDPTIQRNFTPYPNRQPISTLYKTGKVSGYIGKTNNLNQYSDSISLQNAIYDISVSTLDKFLKSRKGDVIKVDTASSIQMKTEDNTTQQALKATIDWVEVGDSSNISIVSVSQDGFWPLA